MSSLVAEIEQARAQKVAVSADSLTIDLVDGRTITAPLLWYPRLWHGTPKERHHLEIIGDGTLIHWPDLDEDLSIAGILAGRRSGESPQSLKKWLAQRTTSGEQTRYRRAPQSSVSVKDKSSVPATVEPRRKMRR
jgi:hypothetical protein